MVAWHYSVANEASWWRGGSERQPPFSWASSLASILPTGAKNEDKRDPSTESWG